MSVARKAEHVVASEKLGDDDEKKSVLMLTGEAFVISEMGNIFLT